MKLSKSLIGRITLLSVLLLGACSTEEANQPDTPSPSGTVNRDVKGVIIND